jgi:hypothetical protein
MAYDCNENTKPLSDPKLESRAQEFEHRLESAYSNNAYEAGLIATKQVAKQFLDETLNAPKEDQAAVFKRAQQLNDIAVCSDRLHGLPILDILFTKPADGSVGSLAGFDVIQRPYAEGSRAYSFKQRLYER